MRCACCWRPPRCCSWRAWPALCASAHAKRRDRAIRKKASLAGRGKRRNPRDRAPSCQSPSHCRVKPCRTSRMRDGASGAGGAPDIPTVKPTAPAPKAVLSSSASELFARANLNRRQGHGAEAASLYQLLLERYPSSREDGPARLALAKYYQAKQPEQALAQFRAVAGSGGALRAEALWGISEVATSLGQRSLAEQALADLIREFPDSPYAEVARTRTTHGLP